MQISSGSDHSKIMITILLSLKEILSVDLYVIISIYYIILWMS